MAVYSERRLDNERDRNGILYEIYLRRFESGESYAVSKVVPGQDLLAIAANILPFARKPERQIPQLPMQTLEELADGPHA